jgi:hypothetical protein
MNFSIMDENIVKVGDLRLKFWYVVALITVHLLIYFPLVNFIRRFSKWALKTEVAYVCFKDFRSVFLSKISLECPWEFTLKRFWSKMIFWW